MKELSVFDIIGPNMIGPSSSHTAGALRIALLAGKIAPGKVKEVAFVLYGSFAKTYRGHGTDRALVAGILGFGTEDYRIRDSFACADEAGIAYSFSTAEDKDLHPNTVEVIITAEDGTVTKVMGVSLGGGVAKVERINGVEVSLSGEYHTLFVQQRDKPGVVAHITQCLSQYGVNIAFMRLYRESKDQTAYTIIEADEPITGEIIAKVRENKNIQSAMIIEM